MDGAARPAGHSARGPRRLRDAAIAFAMAIILPAGTFAQGTLTATHGDWQIRCTEATAGIAAACALSQEVVAEDRPDVGLGVWIWKTSEQGPVLRAIAPLGVSLERGLGLVIDDQTLTPVPFQYCATEGCVAEVLVDERLLGLMRGGETALFVYALHAEPRAGIGVPISLAGFSAGFDALPAP